METFSLLRSFHSKTYVQKMNKRHVDGFIKMVSKEKEVEEEEHVCEDEEESGSEEEDDNSED